QLGRLLTLAFAFILTLGFFAPQSRAASTAPAAPTGQPSTRAIPVPKSAEVPKDGRPTPGTATEAADAPKAAAQLPAAAPQSKQLRSAPAATQAACAFGNSTGSALVQQVKAASLDCVNSLFNLTGTEAQATFREAQMVTVANALRDSATSYNGTNSGSAGQLVLFLRAGYYVQWKYPGVVG
ncbi:M9 family metallopeptidase N-terminal domain-containing protein, partial [Kitasatospora nipponensis]|uniref:M9 family metallopeptidase N-terminal domain-containing protein n=1 Tax=Kitasatospora nipponensis TaxID=258049 RepID=UPI003CD0917A